MKVLCRSPSPSPPPRSARGEPSGQLRPSEQSTAEQYIEGPGTATTSPKGPSSLARWGVLYNCAEREPDAA